MKIKELFVVKEDRAFSFDYTEKDIPSVEYVENKNYRGISLRQ
jgi:hypothetical protein